MDRTKLLEELKKFEEEIGISAEVKVSLHGQFCLPLRCLPSTSDKIGSAFKRQTYDLDI